MTKSDKKRQLNEKQKNAIEHVLLGMSDGEVADQVGVCRQTVNDWRNHEPEFIAELNTRRAEIWSNREDRLRQLVAEAVDILEDNLKSNDDKIRQAAAVHVLKAVGLYGADLKPSGMTDAEAIRKINLFDDLAF